MIAMQSQMEHFASSLEGMHDTVTNCQAVLAQLVDGIVLYFSFCSFLFLFYFYFYFYFILFLTFFCITFFTQRSPLNQMDQQSTNCQLFDVKLIALYYIDYHFNDEHLLLCCIGNENLKYLSF